MEKHGCGCAFLCFGIPFEKQSVRSASGATFKMERISVSFLLKTRRISPKTGREKGKINFIRLVAILWIAWGCKPESIHYNEN
ncbi:MAG: hypothetical protein ACLSA6_09330 [Holdemania massiliensis]